jgi:hypothetical protein
MWSFGPSRRAQGYLPLNVVREMSGFLQNTPYQKFKSGKRRGVVLLETAGERLS